MGSPRKGISGFISLVRTYNLMPVFQLKWELFPLRITLKMSGKPSLFDPVVSKRTRWRLLCTPPSRDTNEQVCGSGRHPGYAVLRSQTFKPGRNFRIPFCHLFWISLSEALCPKPHNQPAAVPRWEMPRLQIPKCPSPISTCSWLRIIPHRQASSQTVTALAHQAWPMGWYIESHFLLYNNGCCLKCLMPS